MKKFSKTMQHIEQMLGWTTQSQTGVASGKPYLSERKGILSLHFDTLSIQSEMCIEMPDKLVVDYTRTMMSFLLLQPSPKRIAMIGLGGGSLAKYCTAICLKPKYPLSKSTPM